MRAAFFDLDGTLTNIHVWQGLMKYFQMEGKKRLVHVWFWVYHMPMYFLYKLGLVSQHVFRYPWGKHLPWYFSGYAIKEAEQIWEWIVEEYLQAYWREDSLSLVENHLIEGDIVVLVSASPAPIVRKVGEKLGIFHVVATEPKTVDGKYNGRVDGEVCLGEYKVLMVKEYLKDQNIQIDYEDSYAYADSPEDVYLLEMVGSPVATHPEKDLRAIAIDKNWKIFPN